MGLMGLKNEIMNFKANLIIIYTQIVNNEYR
jgi:hypothetical protein